MAKRPEGEASRLDEAARAGWLYYIAGNTQDEIAVKLGVSRQTAQRLVSLAVSARLIKVRLDHPIAKCLDLSQRLRDKYHLQLCEVVPADPASQSTTLGVAEAAAAELERRLESQHPIIVAMGSGRTLRAAVEQLPPMDCPQHKIVSLVGNIAPDGSASFYDVIIRIADAVKAPHYPMPLPVIASTTREKALFLTQKSVISVINLARQADVTFVGVGQMGDSAPLVQDGFVNPAEMRALVKAGAVGEIVGWAYDAKGSLIDGLTNDRVASVPLDQPATRLVIAVAMGVFKAKALKAALIGQLLTGLITNETTAELLL
ncbi:MAG: sugar-binding transcriptional regulator [Dongiaceae bacterium]